MKKKKKKKTMIKKDQRWCRKYGIRQLDSLKRIKEHVSPGKVNHSLKKKQSSITKIHKHNGRNSR